MRRYREVEMTDGGTGTLLLCHRVSRGALMMPARYFHGPPRINLCRVDDLTQFISEVLSLASAETDLAFYLGDKLFFSWARPLGNTPLLYSQAISRYPQRV